MNYVKSLTGSAFLGLIGYTDKIITVKTGQKNRFNELINVKTVKIDRPELVI